MAKNLHVMILPWSAFGHLIPFFQLSIALAKAGVSVSFVSTPNNIRRLPKIPQNLETLIKLVEIPLPTLESQSLPIGAEATVDLPSDKIDHLKIAYDLLQYPLKQYVMDQQLDWIIIDVIPHWMVEIAVEMKIPLMHFSVYSASAYLFLCDPGCLAGDNMRTSWESMTSPAERINFPSSVAYRKHEAIGAFEGIYGTNASGITDAERVAKILNSCQAIAIRSCTEFEIDSLNSFQKLMGKPVVPVGLLPLEKPKAREITDGSWGEVFKWLDQQKTKSVVFVSFGSEFKLSQEQVYEIAYGLELSGLPFLWALRKPSWANHGFDVLPSGFRERTSGKGVVSIGWAPQMEILGHRAIGGSLFHSGWGSIIETLQFGHSLVLLPFIIDQPLNARLLVEKELGVEVERSEDGSFNRDGVANALRLAMVSEEGKKLRAGASEAAQVFGNNNLHQDYYIEKFVEFLRNKDYQN
ncbi:UDP-glucosyltransferase, putative [Ricinus communis]|uniref:UDP-glucosyltransferase, putative n=2 Tax=Ricinus communis TaxID=3988 RepID=B9RDW3_RICCO|nr:UDP-glucosyltransferase, putative [Ricinus communis]